jgi:hypothetical protein
LCLQLILSRWLKYDNTTKKCWFKKIYFIIKRNLSQNFKTSIFGPVDKQASKLASEKEWWDAFLKFKQL